MQIISFKDGIPHDDMLIGAEKLIYNALDNVRERYGLSVLRYRTSEKLDFLGFIPLREIIAERYKLNKDNIVATNGCMETIFYALLTIKNLSDKRQDSVLIVEDLTYHRMIETAKILGFRIRGVSLSDEGIDIDHLKKIIEEENGKVKAVYQIPIHHNPTGLNATRENVKKVAEICESNCVYHINDCIYIDMRYDTLENKIPCIGKYSILCGSFTKSLLPGYKCGWGYIPCYFIKEFEYTIGTARINPNYPTQAAISYMIQQGSYDEYIEEKLVPFYGKRASTMNKTIKDYFPETYEIPFLSEIKGGSFSVVRVDLRQDQEEEFRKKCKEKGVLIEKQKFYASDSLDFYSNYGLLYRLAFLNLDPADIYIGVKIMKEIQDEMK